MARTIFTAANILKAYLDCRKTKRKTVNALKYEMDLENNLSRLKEDLANRAYYPTRSICFVVTIPKPREIFAADFGDRIVHHLLINQIQPIWEKSIFIEDSYACRKGKGHHFGILRLSQFVKRYAFYGQFDISNFFSAIDKPILFKLIEKQILNRKKPPWWKEEIMWLTKIIVFNDPTKNFVYKGDPSLKTLIPKGKSLFEQSSETGLPIGNLTSQFFANVYLNELDQFAVQTLKMPGYGRYVDDFAVFSNDKADILDYRQKMQEFLAMNLHLVMHPKKQQIQPCRHGISFVGYFIKPWGITVRRNVVKTAKNKIHYFNSEQNIQKVVTSLNSYYGHFQKAKSDHLRKHLIEKHLSPEIKSKIIVVGNWHHLRLRKRLLN